MKVSCFYLFCPAASKYLPSPEQLGQSVSQPTQDVQPRFHSNLCEPVEHAQVALWKFLETLETNVINQEEWQKCRYYHLVCWSRSPTKKRMNERAVHYNRSVQRHFFRIVQFCPHHQRLKILLHHNTPLGVYLSFICNDAFSSQPLKLKYITDISGQG